jgi:CBS domain-containing protein
MKESVFRGLSGLSTERNLEQDNPHSRIVIREETVSDLMTRRVIRAITSDATVEEAVGQMKATQKGCLLVMQGTRPVGIITERDVVHNVLTEHPLLTDTKVSQVMSELTTIEPEAPVSRAARMLVQKGTRMLVATKDGSVVGIVTATDLLRLMAK